MKMFDDETLQLVWERGLRRVDEVTADEHNQIYGEVADADLAAKFPNEWVDDRLPRELPVPRGSLEQMELARCNGGRNYMAVCRHLADRADAQL